MTHSDSEPPSPPDYPTETVHWAHRKSWTTVASTTTANMKQVDNSDNDQVGGNSSSEEDEEKDYSCTTTTVLTKNNTTSNNSNKRMWQQKQKQHLQQQQQQKKRVQLLSHNDHEHSQTLRQRPRADTMPTQSTTAFLPSYMTPDNNNNSISNDSVAMAASDLSHHPHHHLATSEATVVAPTAAAAASATAVSSAAAFRNRSGSITLPPSNNHRHGTATISSNPFGDGIFNSSWSTESMQSPTTPTTDQLLKEDDGNTIASTLASLGLDDERVDRRHTIHSSHSYSSLRTWYNHHPPSSANSAAGSSEPWPPHHQHYLAPASSSPVSSRGTTCTTGGGVSAANSVGGTGGGGEQQHQQQDHHHQQQQHTPSQQHHHRHHHHHQGLMMAVANKFQTQRPRAISMSVADNRPPFENLNYVPYHRSIWQQQQHQQQHLPTSLRRQQQGGTRPFLRSSNSSADLLEMMARQRRAALGTPTGTGEHTADDWDTATPASSSSSLQGSSSSTYCGGGVDHGSSSGGNTTATTAGIAGGGTEESSSPSSGKNSPASSAAQTPTRSLWLGNIDPSLTMADLQCVFAQFGVIDSVRILPDRECAFVNFISVDDALRAKEGLMHTLNGRLGNSAIKVGFGKPEAVPQQPPTCGTTTTTTTTALAPGAAGTGGEFGANAQGPTRALWIGNIPSTTTYSMLFSLFSPFGAIESVRVLTHKNCGFVNFESQEDAVRAKKTLQGKEIMGPATGPVRIGFAKVPTMMAMVAGGPPGGAPLPGGLMMGGGPPPTGMMMMKPDQYYNNSGNNDMMMTMMMTCPTSNTGGAMSAVDATAENLIPVASSSAAAVAMGWTAASTTPPPPTSVANNSNNGSISGNTGNGDGYQHEQQQQMMMYMMAEMMGNGSTNIYAAITSERQVLMSELGGTEDENDGPLFDEMHMPLSYFATIPAAPELGQARKIDIGRLRDIRKRLDTGYVPTKELEVIALECLDELVELCSDHIGNTVIQRLFERCSEVTKSRMLDVVAPYLASIGIHKNGTWAAQKIIDTGRLPAQINRICASIKPYVPALLLDQFGNYVVQCCLGLGPERNQFIFDAIVDNCWEIAQGRFGARAVRATLESPHVTKRQQKYVAATIVQHALVLATNANGALLLIWLLDTSGIPGRYRVLAPRLTPHLARLCTHKLASLTVLKIINQRHEPDARALILDALVFSADEQVIDEVLKDQVHGVNLIQKILSSSYVELRERQRIAERIKHVLNKLKLQHVQGYKRLMEEINMVMGDSNPGASLGALPGLVPPTFAMNPEMAAALHAKYLAAAAAAVAAAHPQQQQQPTVAQPVVQPLVEQAVLESLPQQENQVMQEDQSATQQVHQQHSDGSDDVDDEPAQSPTLPAVTAAEAKTANAATTSTATTTM